MKRLLLAAVLLAGCKHASDPVLKDAPPPSLPAGWTPVADAESGVSLALPSGWRVGVPKSFDMNSVTNPSGDPSVSSAGDPPPASDPSIAEMERKMQRDDEEAERKTLAKMREKDGIVLHCVDGSKPTIGEEPTRLYVKKIPGADFSSHKDAAISERQNSHRNAKIEEVTLPVGKASRLLAQGRNRIGDEECHVTYIFLDGEDAYVLRFASTNSPEAILSIERQVAETFRVKHKGK